MPQTLTWLLLLVSLSSYVSAFYPYTTDAGEGAAINKRFIPIQEESLEAHTESGSDPGTGLWKFDLHKVQKQKRDNRFSVVISNPASYGANGLAVNQDGADYSYFSTMKFGSKGQNMFMLIDTGSANTWVFASDCKSNTCSIHNTFGKDNSTSLNITTQTWTLAYGTGQVSGVVAFDTVAFANFSLNTGFGLADSASDDFNNYPMDGILGLGRKGSDQLGTPPIMQVLRDQGKLSSSVVGIHLHRAADNTKDGEIVFGGIDTAKFSGVLAYTKTSNDDAWEIPVDDVLINGTPCNFTSRTAIVDTGTTFILLPPADAKALHTLIPGSAPNGESYNIPCNTNVKLEVRIGGISYSISPKDYVGKPISGSTTTCTSNIIGHQAFGPQQWILGDVFLKNVYSVFDFDNKQIGLGLPGTGGTLPTSSTTSSTPKSSSTATASTSRSASATGTGTKSSSASTTDSNIGGSTSDAKRRVVVSWKVGFSIAIALNLGVWAL